MGEAVGDTLAVTAHVRVLEPGDLRTAWDVLARAFGSAVHEEDTAVELALVDLARFLGVHADDRTVATAGSFALRMAVPGAVLPVAAPPARPRPDRRGARTGAGARRPAAAARARRPPAAPADPVLRPDDLGAAHLGGTPLRSRPVEERTAGALDVTSTALGPLGPAPWCPQVF